MKWHFAASLSVVSTRQGLKSLADSDNRQGLKSLADSDNRQGLKSLVNSPSPLQWTEYKFLVHFNGLKLLAWEIYFRAGYAVGLLAWEIYFRAGYAPE